MTSQAESVAEYIKELPDGRQPYVKKLRAIIRKNLPKGFKEMMNYGMIGYVVPHTKYLDGYHCNPKLPLPFINVASQKNYIALYHLGVYADPKLFKWFTNEYPKHCDRKLDMGKSCVRFKKVEEIPYDLIGKLVAKMTVEDWIKLYEKNVKSK